MKKLRKKRRPIYTRGWFVLLACLAVVGVVGGVIYYGAIAPPSAESLIQKIDAAKDPKMQQDLAAEYLKYYGSRTDDATNKVRAIDRSMKVAERERVLLNRFGMQNMRAHPAEGDDADAYGKTMAAMTVENAGDLPEARRLWGELAGQYENDPIESKALWGWVAEKKLGDLDARERQLAEIGRRLDDEFRLEDKDPHFGDEATDRVATALRLEQFGDTVRARERWEQMATALAGDKEHRADFVFARGQAHRLAAGKSSKDADVKDLIQGKLAEAQAQLNGALPANKRRGRNTLRDIRDLYQGETGEIGKLVDQAKQLLAKNPAL
jgi:hypothetical protein